MKKTLPVTTLFLDIGGVLLTNGWDHHARRRAARYFTLEWAEMEQRHLLNVAVYEEGRLSLEDYLNRVVFFRKRNFTRTRFQDFMFAQSTPCRGMIEMFARLKVQHGLRIAAVSNEAREVNAYRIRKFKLAGLLDSFISSCFVHVRKPDPEIFRLSLDISLASARHVLYVENTPLFLQIAEGLGIRGMLHTNYTSTRAKLAAYGLGILE